MFYTDDRRLSRTKIKKPAGPRYGGERYKIITDICDNLKKKLEFQLLICAHLRKEYLIYNSK